MPACVVSGLNRIHLREAYPALVILWGNQAVKNHPGEHRYTMMTTILTGTRPRHAPMTQTSPLPAS